MLGMGLGTGLFDFEEVHVCPVVRSYCGGVFEVNFICTTAFSPCATFESTKINRCTSTLRSVDKAYTSCRQNASDSDDRAPSGAEEVGNHAQKVVGESEA